MANTISTKTWRDKYRSASLGHLLRRALIAEKICNVDRSGAKTIQNPYSSTPTVTISALTGTYTISDWTTTDDTLTVDTEFKIAEHVFDFEETLARFDLFAARQDQQNFAIKEAIDKYVLNTLVDQAGQTAVAASMGATGGFSTAANLPIIVSNLASLVAGYAEAYRGTYLVLEAGDTVGVMQQMLTSGTAFADARLNNGWINNYAGVDIYVTRPSTFANYSPGNGVTFTNQGKRLFGVKGSATYAEPQGVRFEEKGVSLKTGMEIVTYGYIGAKVWATNSALTIALTNVGASPSSSVSPSVSLSPSVSPSKSPSKSPSVSPS